MIQTDINDSKQFENLNEMYGKLFNYIALKILRDRYLAEDAVQNSFYLIVKNNVLERFEDITSDYAKNYFARIVENEARKLLIRKKKDQEHIVDNYGLLNEIPCNDTVEMTVVEAINCREIVKTLMDMPSKYSGAIVMHGIYGHSYKSISRQSGINVETVKKRLYRGKKMLRSRLNVIV